MKVSGITVKNLVEYLKINYSGLLEEEITEIAVFLQTAISFIQSYTGLTLEEIDKHEDFVVAVYVLVQDMYDNRSYYVDKNNLNKVVETILGMHAVNLI